MYKEYNFHRFFITDKSHRYITWTLNLDNFLGRSVEFYSNTLLLLKDLFGLLKKVVPLSSILEQNIGIGLRYGLDNPIT